MPMPLTVGISAASCTMRGSLHAAVSGIKQALWDVCGKKLGGAVRRKLRAYANIGDAPGRLRRRHPIRRRYSDDRRALSLQTLQAGPRLVPHPSKPTTHLTNLSPQTARVVC